MNNHFPKKSLRITILHSHRKRLVQRVDIQKTKCAYPDETQNQDRGCPVQGDRVEGLAFMGRRMCLPSVCFPSSKYVNHGKWPVFGHLTYKMAVLCDPVSHQGDKWPSHITEQLKSSLQLGLSLSLRVGFFTHSLFQICTSPSCHSQIYQINLSKDLK